MATESIPDRGPQMIAAGTTTWILAVICVALRFVCRKIRGGKLWLDDWLIMFALVWAAGNVFTVISYQIPKGLGKHIEHAAHDAVFSWALGLFVGELTYVLTLVVVKFSILAFYWRIFNTLDSIKTPIWFLLGVVSAWGIANIFVIIFQCIPVEAFWARFHVTNPMSPSNYHCGVDDRQFFFGTSISNVLTDILLIALPIPYISRIRLPTDQKIGLVGIFLLGAFIVVISVVRLVYIIKVDVVSEDITWNFVDAAVWTMLEADLAIVCACLPSLKPILDLVVHGTLLSKSERTGTRHSRTELTRRSSGITGSRYDVIENELDIIHKDGTQTADDSVSDRPSGLAQEHQG